MTGVNDSGFINVLLSRIAQKHQRLPRNATAHSTPGLYP